MNKKNDSKQINSEEQDKLVSGIFKNVQFPGQPVKFCFRQYGTKINTYHLEHGKEYTLPLSVAKHLNNCNYYKHSFLLDKNGNQIKDQNPVERFTFQSLEFN